MSILKFAAAIVLTNCLVCDLAHAEVTSIKFESVAQIFQYFADPMQQDGDKVILAAKLLSENRSALFSGELDTADVVGVLRILGDISYTPDKELEKKRSR